MSTMEGREKHHEQFTVPGVKLRHLESQEG